MTHNMTDENLDKNLIEQINDILPQTQCTRCGYPSCKDYAIAITTGDAEINQCPPGGNEGIAKLASLLHKPIKPLNPINGSITPKTLIRIDEDVCIGCALCLKVCPVDAIVGANKMIHTILAEECTGCDLCIPACPVDCMHIIADPNSEWTSTRANHARMRYDNRLNRQEQLKKSQMELLNSKSVVKVY